MLEHQCFNSTEYNVNVSMNYQNEQVFMHSQDSKLLESLCNDGANIWARSRSSRVGRYELNYSLLICLHM